MDSRWDYTKDEKEPVVHLERIALTASSEVHKVCTMFTWLTPKDEEFDDVKGIC
jgi:hypothetical protein